MARDRATILTGVTEPFMLAAVERAFPTGVLMRQVEIEDLAAIAEWNAAIGTPGWFRGTFSRRIDGLLFDGADRVAIEVKVSFADFKRESDAKRAVWRRSAHSFVYLAPLGVIPHDRVPAGVGLWEHDGEDLVIAIDPERNYEPIDLPFEVPAARTSPRATA